MYLKSQFETTSINGRLWEPITLKDRKIFLKGMEETLIKNKAEYTYIHYPGGLAQLAIPKEEYDRIDKEFNIKQQQKQTAIANKTKKPCLRCNKPFLSTGAHNRLCLQCRAFTEGADMNLIPIDCGYRKRKHGSAN